MPLVRIALMVCSVLVGMVSLAVAQDVRPLQFRTSPGGAVVHGDDGTRITDPSASPSESSFTLQASVAGIRRYRLEREHFAPMSLSVRWDDDLGRWAFAEGPRTGQGLTSEERFEFGKWVRLATFPPGATAFWDVRACGGWTTAEGRDSTPLVEIEVAGTRRKLERLPVDAQGRVLVPRAGAPPPIMLVRPHFHPRIVQFRPGELDEARDTFPEKAISLDPVAGPFSYWQFNVALTLLLSAGIGGWWAVIRPRRRQQQQEQERRLALADAITSQAHRAAGFGAKSRATSALGLRLRSDSGREYVLLGLLGEGGMARVFEAVQADGDDTSPRWAVKLLYGDSWQDADARTRFEREMEVYGCLHHPGIVKLQDWGYFEPPGAESGERAPFMVLELLSGRDLRAILDASPHRRFEVGTAVGILTEALRAIHVAHLAGVVHRDLKPPNLRITESGRVKIMDFGIARSIDHRTLTQVGTVLGTPRYMAPEQLSLQPATPASDVYALGVIGYEMLAGVTPFHDPDTQKLFQKIARGTCTPLATHRPEVPVPLARIVERMMARDLRHRYVAADEVLADLAGNGPIA